MSLSFTIENDDKVGGKSNVQKDQNATCVCVVAGCECSVKSAPRGPAWKWWGQTPQVAEPWRAKVGKLQKKDYMPCKELGSSLLAG